MKKILSILLAFVMVLCLIPSSVLPVSALSVQRNETGELQPLPGDAGINADFVTSVTISPERQKIKKGNSFTFTAEVIGSVTTVNWSVLYANSSSTYIDSGGRLTVAADETATYLTVKAESTLDSSIYGTAEVRVTDEDVYISKVTVTPASVSIPKGGNQQFTANVEGTDYTDVTWTLSGQDHEETRIDNYGYLKVSANETASVLRIRATSVRNTNVYGEAVAYVTGQQTINNVKVVYDTSKVGLVTTMTGRQVTTALGKAVDKSDVAEGTSIDTSPSYTCLVKDVSYDGTGNVIYTKLNDSDELIDEHTVYYFMFNVENKEGYIWDTDALPSATVNGADADHVGWRSKNTDGDINVFKRVYVEGASPYQAEFQKIEDQSAYAGYTSNPSTQIVVTNTGSLPLNIDSSCLTISNTEDFYTYSYYVPPTLQPGNSFTVNLVLKEGKDPALYETDVTFRDLNGKMDAINTHAKMRVIGEITEIYINGFDMPKAGESAYDYYFDFYSADTSKYVVFGGSWNVKVGDDYYAFEAEDDIFELGKTYYLYMEIENVDDSWVFALDHYDPSILRVEDFYINYNKVEPVFDFYDYWSYWSEYGYWIELMIPFTVTKSVGDDVEVTPYPSYAFTEGVDYTVDGQYVTVYGDTPCKVGYLSDGKYEACSIYSYSGNRHTFVVPDSVDEVMLVIKGDVDLSGEFDFFDVVVSKAMDLHPEDGYSIEELFAADVDDDGEFSFFDVILTKAADLGKTPFSWL